MHGASSEQLAGKSIKVEVNPKTTTKMGAAWSQTRTVHCPSRERGKVPASDGYPLASWVGGNHPGPLVCCVLTTWESTHLRVGFLKK